MKEYSNFSIDYKKSKGRMFLRRMMLIELVL